jgi:hypothetical protein
MQGDRDFLDLLIDKVAHCMAEVDITEYDGPLIREVPQEIAALYGSRLRHRSSETISSLPAATPSAGGKVAYSKEEMEVFF